MNIPLQRQIQDEIQNSALFWAEFEALYPRRADLIQAKMVLQSANYPLPALNFAERPVFRTGRPGLRVDLSQLGGSWRHALNCVPFLSQLNIGQLYLDPMDDIFSDSDVLEFSAFADQLSRNGIHLSLSLSLTKLLEGRFPTGIYKSSLDFLLPLQTPGHIMQSPSNLAAAIMTLAHGHRLGIASYELHWDHQDQEGMVAAYQPEVALKLLMAGLKTICPDAQFLLRGAPSSFCMEGCLRFRNSPMTQAVMAAVQEGRSQNLAFCNLQDSLNSKEVLVHDIYLDEAMFKKPSQDRVPQIQLTELAQNPLHNLIDRTFKPAPIDVAAQKAKQFLSIMMMVSGHPIYQFGDLDLFQAWTQNSQNQNGLKLDEFLDSIKVQVLSAQTYSKVSRWVDILDTFKDISQKLLTIRLGAKQLFTPQADPHLLMFERELNDGMMVAFFNLSDAAVECAQPGARLWDSFDGHVAAFGHEAYVTRKVN